jgi:hypothetical protein
MSALAELRRLIADDAFACTFQTFGQYRTALLKAVDAARGIEVRSTETEGLGPEGAEPGAEGTRPDQSGLSAAAPVVDDRG